MADTPLTQLARQAFEAGDGAGLPVCFSLEVLRKYQEDGATLIRTKNAGRVMLLGPMSFRLDFGIHDDTRTITVLLGEFLRAVPKPERSRWAEFLVVPPLNERFLKMRVRSGCVDDGDLTPIEL